MLHAYQLLKKRQVHRPLQIPWYSGCFLLVVRGSVLGDLMGAAEEVARLGLDREEGVVGLEEHRLT